MKNSDMPAMPIEFNGFGQYAPEAHLGLTKREVIAKEITLGDFKFNSVDDMGEFIGREVDESSTLDLIKASAECDAKIRVIYADALLKELEK